VTVVCIAGGTPAVEHERLYSPAGLAGQALAIAPRIRLEPLRGLLWADARDLDARSMASRLLDLADGSGWTGAGAGIAATPIAALVAARTSAGGAGTDRVRVVPPGHDRELLAPLDIGVLDPPPPPALYPLLAAVGIAKVADLARLDRESVEVRFGADGVRLWRLARAADTAPLFDPRPPELPRAELEWVDYELDRQEQVLFIVNSLLGTVCTALAARSQGAHAMSLDFALADRTGTRHPVRCSTPTADRRTWLRVIRATLDSLQLGAPVTRITLAVEGAAPLGARQGDLFDAGFATARATDAALAHLLDRQPDALVASRRTRHPLPEERLAWEAERGESPSDAAGSGTATLPRLSLMVLGAPRRVDVGVEPRQDGEAPTRYRDGLTVYPLAHALGPDRVSGGFGDRRFDREYFQGVRADGMVVLLYRDLTDNQWFLGGWWD
jgi:hypothetical protein